MATTRLRFLLDDQGFDGPETERPWDEIPAITRVRYHRNDMTIEVTHAVGLMGENYVQTRCRQPGGDGLGDWIELGRHTTHTGYQLRRGCVTLARLMGN